MAATLKLTLMSHVEEREHWDAPDDPHKDDPNAIDIAHLATIVGAAVGAHAVPRGAKVSVQFDRPYLDQNDPDVPALERYPPPTSLSWVLENEGNFWCHSHSATYNHLQSTHTCVSSAVAAEIGTTYAYGESHSAGRSGGANMNDATLDWASISAAAGILRMNGSVLNFYATTAESLRPYGVSNADIQQGAFFHDAAPGPLYEGAPTTMRQRPFYIDTASVWDANIDCIYPHTDQLGSIMMIPNPGRYALHALAEGRSAASEEALTIDDFKAAMTEIWTTYEQMAAHQSSITNVWYVHIQPGQINAADIGTFGAWVDSINEMMAVHTGSPKAVWKNFNEIASLYTNPSSFNW